MDKKFILSIALIGTTAQANAQREEKYIEEITTASKSNQKINKVGETLKIPRSTSY